MGSEPDNIPPETAKSRVDPGSGSRRYRYSSGPAASSRGGGDASRDITASTPAIAVAQPSMVWERVLIALAAAGVCLVALYRAEIRELQVKWYSDPGWSHGFVVPLISIFLIRIKWDTLRLLVPRGTWVGLLVLLLGVVGQVLFRATGTQHMSNLSILVVLIGTVLFVFGWQYLKVLWLPIGYLVCAIPLPGALYVKLTTPMQELAAQIGVSFLPLFGAAGQRIGTLIEVVRNDGVVKLNVEQACSGMRMLVAFFALAVALAYSTTRPMWQKLFLAICALPIAILCNALRVTLTGVLVAKWGPQWAEGSAHAYFGMLMLVPAMFMQLGLAWILDRIFVEQDDSAGPVEASGGAA